MSDYIGELQAAFLALHGCDATYVETVPVVRRVSRQDCLARRR
jgi:hypothetical protein